ncbi:hypothetical protein BJX64DRAFT_288636 [Aspergillus heterothallicus]
MPRIRTKDTSNKGLTSSLPGNYPAGPSDAALRCSTLETDGSVCSRRKIKPEYRYCPPHHREQKELYLAYKDAEHAYRQLVLLTDEKNETWLALARKKAALGHKTIDLRNKVNHRFFTFPTGFFPQQQDNRSHVRWILALQMEIQVLDEEIDAFVSKSSTTQSGTTRGDDQVDSPEGSGERQGQLVLGSLLSPDVPWSALAHLPEDSPVRTFKTILEEMAKGAKKRLYEIVPSINDSSPFIKDDGETAERNPDDGDHVLRFVFRQYLHRRADADALVRASQSKTIDHFLQLSSPNELKQYIKFFETLGVGREDTLHFLRDAVCDYLLPADAGTETLTLVGERVAISDEQRKTTVESWDILYKYFNEFVDFTTVEYYCFQFQDVVLIKQLIALGRYSEWEDKTAGVSVEKSLSVIYGFIPFTLSYSDPPIPIITEEDGIQTHTQQRHYLAGRMSNNDPRTKLFIKDMLRRVHRHIVVIYENGVDALGSSKLIQHTDDISDDLWIKRCRSGKANEMPGVPWDIQLSFKDIRRDMDLMRAIRERNMRPDYVEIVIVDRHPRVRNVLPYIVSGALAVLDPESPPRETITNVIRRIMPPLEQARWMEATSWEGFPEHIRPIEDFCYEGNRQRAWNNLDTHRHIVRDATGKAKTPPEARVIRAILNEMERRGLITGLTEYAVAHCSPVILPGYDGREDLYFHYHLQGPVNSTAAAPSPSPLNPVSTAESIRRSISAYQQSHPEAVFARGRLDVHYCAWPIPPTDNPRFGVPTFCTSEGYLYRWNVLPFDFPASQQVWQRELDEKINSKVPFAWAVETTVVVAAPAAALADVHLSQLRQLASNNIVDISSRGAVSRKVQALDALFTFPNSLWHSLRQPVILIRAVFLTNATVLQFITQHPLCDASGGRQSLRDLFHPEHKPVDNTLYIPEEKIRLWREEARENGVDVTDQDLDVFQEIRGRDG